MSMPVSVGHPDYKADGLIPDIFSAKMLMEWYETDFMADITCNDYTGELNGKGDKVIIPILPEPEIDDDYAYGQDIEYPLLVPSSITLEIDKASLWKYRTDNVANYHSLVNWANEQAPHCQKKASLRVQRRFLADIYSSAHAANAGATAGVDSGLYDLGEVGTPVVLSSSNVIEFITRCGCVLDEQMVPEDNRFMVIPVWMSGLIKNSELKNANQTGDPKSILRTGYLGEIDNFTLYKSTQVEHVVDGADTVANLVFGHKKAVAFALNYTDTRLNFDLEKSIGKASRGLTVYGYKAIKPEGLGHGYVTQ